MGHPLVRGGWAEGFILTAQGPAYGVTSPQYIAAGPWAGRKCIGCSLVIGPGGGTVLRGPYGEDAEAVLFVDVAPHRRSARGSGWQT